MFSKVLLSWGNLFITLKQFWRAGLLWTPLYFYIFFTHEPFILITLFLYPLFPFQYSYFLLLVLIPNEVGPLFESDLGLCTQVYWAHSSGLNHNNSSSVQRICQWSCVQCLEIVKRASWYLPIVDCWQVCLFPGIVLARLIALSSWLECLYYTQR